MSQPGPSGTKSSRPLTPRPVETAKRRHAPALGRPALIVAAVALALVAGLRTAPQSTRPAARRSVAHSLPLRKVGTVALPGPANRFEYAADDPAAHLLWLAHMGNSTIVEVDTSAWRVVRVIPGIAEVTGIIVVPALHRVFTSAPGSGQVVTIDETSGAVLARAPAGSFPDHLAYVPSTHQVWVSDEEGGVETVIDASSGQAVATVALGGEAGNVRYEAADDRVLVDVQTRDQLVVIDPRSRAVERRIHIPGCNHDHGIAVSPSRVFVACDGNSVVVVMSLSGFKVLGRFRVGATPDVLALDPVRHLLYVAAESGVVTMVNTAAPAVRVIRRAWLGGDAHVVAVDPKTGEAYFPLPTGRHGKPDLLITSPL